MIIDITDHFSDYYLIMLDKFNRGEITSEQFTQYTTTLLLWQEQRDIYFGYDLEFDTFPGEDEATLEDIDNNAEY